MRYLYSAAVRGIQSFIFQTNKLKEIAGASNLIDRLFTRTNGEKSLFDEFCRKREIPPEDLQIITAAAGNLTCIVSKEYCEKIVRYFPKFVSSEVPGVEFVQVALPLENSQLDSDVFQEKRVKSLLEQRNRPFLDIDPPHMGVRKSRLTGGAAVTVEDGVWLDRSNDQKRKYEDSHALFQRFTGLNDVGGGQIPLDFNYLCEREGGDYHWLAVIHADGNSVGKRIMSLLGGSNDVVKALSTFSDALQKATERAVNRACAQFVNKKYNEIYPIRPIILGGDDITLVIRGDLALDFTNAYLTAFEEETRAVAEQLGGQGLTACAGVAFVKRNFPFHYGVQLSDELTKRAKTEAKRISEENPPSAVSFYKVHSSFVEPLADMHSRSHAAPRNKQQSGKSFLVKAYFLQSHGNFPTIGSFLERLEYLREQEESSLALSKLRRYVEEAKHDFKRAKIILDRIQEVNESLYDALHLDEECNTEAHPSMLYDLLEIYSIVR